MASVVGEFMIFVLFLVIYRISNIECQNFNYAFYIPNRHKYNNDVYNKVNTNKLLTVLNESRLVFRATQEASPPRVQQKPLIEEEMYEIGKKLKQEEEQILEKQRILEHQQQLQIRQQQIEQEEFRRQEELLIRERLILQQQKNALKQQIGQEAERNEAQNRKQYLQELHFIFEQFKAKYTELLGNLKLLTDDPNSQVNVYKSHFERSQECFYKLLISVSNMQGQYLTYRFGPDFNSDSECNFIDSPNVSKSNKDSAVNTDESGINVDSKINVVFGNPVNSSNKDAESNDNNENVKNAHVNQTTLIEESDSRNSSKIYFENDGASNEAVHSNKENSIDENSNTGSSSSSSNDLKKDEDNNENLTNKSVSLKKADDSNAKTTHNPDMNLKGVTTLAPNPTTRKI